MAQPMWLAFIGKNIPWTLIVETEICNSIFLTQKSSLSFEIRIPDTIMDNELSACARKRAKRMIYFFALEHG